MSLFFHLHTYCYLLRKSDEIKIVLLDRGDYEWAREILQRHQLTSRVRTLLFSPVHGVLDPALLAAWILEDNLPVTLQLQLHGPLWPQVTRGV